MFSSRARLSKAASALPVSSLVDGSVTITGTVNIDTAIISAGRTKPDAISYTVLGLSSNSATLAVAPVAGELSAGDEVMLINLTGIATAYANTGNYEYVRVQSIVGAVVTFTSNKTKFYGDTELSDSNLGTVPGTNQIVSLRRVPNWDTLTINSGAVLTCNGFNGLMYGQVIFRCKTLTNNGTIQVSGCGFGIWGGMGAPGSGGSGGSMTSGGTGGPSWGVADLSKIFLGAGGGNSSGSGGGSGAGGGIIIINSTNITVLGLLYSYGAGAKNGSLYGGGGGCGGQILIKTTSLTFGSNSVLAYGGAGTVAAGGSGRDGGGGGLGKIAVYANSKTGAISANPAASSYAAAP